MTWLVLAAAAAATPISLDEVRAGARQNLQAIVAELQANTASVNRVNARSAILPRLDVSATVGDTFAGPQRRFSTVCQQDAAGKCVSDANGQIVYVQQSVDTPSVNYGQFQLGLTVTQLLYDGGRWWNQIAQASSQEEAAKGQFEEQKLASELEAVRRFFELVRAQLTLKVLQASVERSRDQLSRAKSLFEAGRGQRRDVLDAEVNLGNDEISVMRQEQAIASAQVDLLEWLGRPVDDIEAVVPESMSPKTVLAAAPDAGRLLEVARQKRPLIHTLEAQVRAGELAVSVARSNYFPSLSLQGGYSRSAPSANPFFTDPTKQNALFIGLNLNWNVFNGFATDAAVDSADVQRRQTVAQQKQSLAELEGELRRTLRTLETQLRISQVAEKNKDLSERELNVEVERFNAGAGSNIDVRNAQVKVTQAQLTQLQGRVDVEIARAALQRVSGASLEAAP